MITSPRAIPQSLGAQSLRARSLRRGFCAVLLAAAVSMSSAAPARAQQTGVSSRERSGLAEDQALLQRQLTRLRQTMEILAARFETEGRTHAAKLLREGLSHIGERATEQGSKTVDELMGGARASLDSGQTVQAVEVQESVVRSLEKLYAILTDRQGLDDLEHSLEALQRIKADLNKLADQEKELHEKTGSLESSTASPERKDLQEGIQKALEAQRSLLGRTETQARESGEMEIEAISRELEALLARQATDTAVLESWKPEERSSLDAAASPLAQAAEHAAAAQRLSQAAREMREAAAAARDNKRDITAAARDLDTSASREERRERAAGEGADARASKALRTGAKALSDAPPTPEGRENAAHAVEEQAAALERAAEAELTAAREARQAAQSSLSPLAGKKTAAGEVADRALAALSHAPKSGGDTQPGGDQKPGGDTQPSGDPPKGKLGERAEAESRTDAEARRALSGGLDEEATLPKALSASQASAAEDAARLERALGARPEGQSSPGAEARKSLEAAAEAQKSAAQSAAKGAASSAAEQARKALEHLAAAREALARAREANAAGSPKSPDAQAQKALASEQEALAKSLESLEQKAQAAEASSSAGSKSSPGTPSSPQGSPPSSPQGSPSAETKSALASAKSAMQSAAKSLKSGGASPASSAQRQAIEDLQKAAESARKAANPASPEDREKAQELAKEQEKIRSELLDLARRNEKRDTAKPSPSLSQAGSSAGKAKEALDEADLQSAQGSEEDAERKMREALSQLSDEEEKYQKLRAEELLFKVAEQVKGMLESHRERMKETAEIDGARKPGDTATHTQRLRLRKVSKSEEGLATRAAEVEKAIRAEESLVFAEVLNEAGRDLLRVARDLGEEGGFQSGERVQGLQQDVEQGLAWLYQALQFEKERRRQEESPPGGSQSGQRGKNRLVPDAAELKLLRQLEVEHLDALEKFKAAHPEIAEGADADPMLLEDLGRLANRHQRTSDLFEKFRRRLGLPDPASQEP